MSDLGKVTEYIAISIVVCVTSVMGILTGVLLWLMFLLTRTILF